MTKKHFEAIAALIRPTADPDNPVEVEVIRNLAERMAAMFARENPRFDRDQFLTACGF